jgi:hypothetical protein
VRRRPAAGGEALSRPPAVDPASPTPPRRLLRGSEQLSALVGQRLLVGLRYVRPDGDPLSSIQFCGRVLEVGDGVVVVANPEAAEPVALPADPAAYTPGPPGRYTLKHSGEIVVDPDYVTTWTIVVDHTGGAGSGDPL